MAPGDDCMHEMFVLVRFAGRRFGVLLAQLEAVGTDEETREGIEDWRYWMKMGYAF